MTGFSGIQTLQTGQQGEQDKTTKFQPMFKKALYKWDLKCHIEENSQAENVRSIAPILLI